MKKCFNFKIFLLLFTPILGFLFGLCFALFSHGTATYLSLPFMLGSGIIIIFLLIREPIWYEISEKGIVITCCFSHYEYAWKIIDHIELKYDVWFEVFLIQDYVIIQRNCLGETKRHERILKNRKTEKMINEFGKGKLALF